VLHDLLLGVWIHMLNSAIGWYMQSWSVYIIAAGVEGVQAPA
jgi:hypothetical protein